MGKQKYKRSVTFIFAVSTFCCCFAQDNEISGLQRDIINSVRCDGNDLNMFIYNLNYNRDEVLVYKGETVGVVEKEGHLDESNNFIVVNRERKSIEKAKAEVEVLTSIENRTYPGSLFLANYHFIDNSPDILSVERGPLRYTVNLPGLTKDGSFEIVPMFDQYQAALRNVLTTWFEKYESNRTVSALFHSDYSFAYSKEQLRVKFGLAFKNTSVEVDIDFNAINENKKLILISKFQQIFYTVSVWSPYRPAGLFGPSVNREELASKINNENPPVLVDRVSYGRVTYVKIETTSTDKKAKLLLETKLSKIDAGADSEVDYSRQLKNFNMQVYVMGGGREHIERINAGTLKDVNNVIIKNSKFGRNNNGYPISYSSKFIRDNSVAVIKSTTEYTQTTRTEYRHGLIKLKHTGAFVARWRVEWDEINYDSNGKLVKNRNGWYKNGHNLTAPFSEDIQLGGNCQNIAALAEEATGLLWERWRRVIDRSDISLTNKRKFSIWGTTLHPKSSIEPPA